LETTIIFLKKSELPKNLTKNFLIFFLIVKIEGYLKTHPAHFQNGKIGNSKAYFLIFPFGRNYQ